MTKINHQPRFPVIATLVAFTAIVIMLLLGFWQLDRKDQKEVRLANIENATNVSALQMADIVANAESFIDFKVESSGVLLSPTFLIDNKIIDGQAGFHVLKPFETNYGVVMLNFGWLKSLGPRGVLPNLTFGSKNVARGVIYKPSDNKLVTETNINYGSFPALLQQVDLVEISRHLNKDVLPFVIRLDPDDSGYIRDWQVITMSPEKHLGYAIQWFGLAIAALTIYLLSVLKKFQAPSVKNN